MLVAAPEKGHREIAKRICDPPGATRYDGLHHCPMLVTLTPHDALLVIDMQVDFMPGGALAIAGASDIIPAINTVAQRFDHVLLTQDWHPRNHISFASTHGREPFPPEGQSTVEARYGLQHLWPDHCVQGTPGAEFHPDLHIPHAELLLRKGFRKDIDSYSAFTENDGTTPTGLAGYLRERDLRRLFFTGVAFDFCVAFSAIAAAQLGFESIVLEDLTRAVNLPGTTARTRQNFARHGVTSMRAEQIVA